MLIPCCIYLVAVADYKQDDQTASKEKEQQLQAELEIHQAKTLKLELELQGYQKQTAFLAGQVEQLQKELEMLKQQGKGRVYGADSTCIAVMY